MESLAERLPWYLAGPSLALIVVLLQWAANLPLGATGAIASLPTWLRGRGEQGGAWRLWFLGGMFLGGFLFATAKGGFSPGFENGRFDTMFGGAGLAGKAIILGGAGVLIGYGARTAGGCTSGHGICGISRGSSGSMVSTGI